MLARLLRHHWRAISSTIQIVATLSPRNAKHRQRPHRQLHLNLNNRGCKSFGNIGPDPTQAPAERLQVAPLVLPPWG
jgi:hypothetical protein